MDSGKTLEDKLLGRNSVVFGYTCCICSVVYRWCCVHVSYIVICTYGIVCMLCMQCCVNLVLCACCICNVVYIWCYVHVVYAVLFTNGIVSMLNM